MLGGGLLPGTLTVVYGATGIGKTHLGLTVADHGRVANGARGVVLDMNGRGDSQQHDEYAARLFDCRGATGRGIGERRSTGYRDTRRGRRWFGLPRPLRTVEPADPPLVGHTRQL